MSREVRKLSFSNIDNSIMENIALFLFPTNKKVWNSCILVSHYWLTFLSSEIFWSNFIELDYLKVKSPKKIATLFFHEPQCRKIKYLPCDFIGRNFIYEITKQLMSDQLRDEHLNSKEKENFQEYPRLRDLVLLGIINLDCIEPMKVYHSGPLHYFGEALITVFRESIKDENDTRPLDFYQLVNIPGAIEDLKKTTEKLNTYCQDIPEKREIESIISTKLSWFNKYQERHHHEYSKFSIEYLITEKKPKPSSKCLIC